jgi:hypothetical protein
MYLYRISPIGITLFESCIREPEKEPHSEPSKAAEEEEDQHYTP